MVTFFRITIIIKSLFESDIAEDNGTHMCTHSYRKREKERDAEMENGVKAEHIKVLSLQAPGSYMVAGLCLSCSTPI